MTTWETEPEELPASAPVHKPCTRCGSSGPFKSKLSRICVECDGRKVDRRKAALKPYHRSRSRAISLLVARHHDEFAALWEQTKREVAKEDAAAQGKQ